MKITHITSAHSRESTRIFHKMASSSVNFGHEVSIVVADGKKNEVKNFVSFYDVGRFNNKYIRFLLSSLKVVIKAKSLDADVYHLHDPDLLLWALLLRGRGKKVFFDAHEDYPLQILHKHYINRYLRTVFSRAFQILQTFVCKRLYGVIGATPIISKKFDHFIFRTIDIKNYPLRSEFNLVFSPSKSLERSCFTSVYVGGITSVRGIKEVVMAHELLNEEFSLKLAGKFLEPNLQDILQSMPGWSRVEYKGFLSRVEIVSLLKETNCGVVTLHPTANYIDALPIKMFEYMAAGIPIIASDFPILKSIVEKYNCGLLVDPLDSVSISQAIRFLSDNPSTAKQMGENGKRAFDTDLNFDSEAIRLNDFYNL